MFLYNMKRGACESTPFMYIYKVIEKSLLFDDSAVSVPRVAL